MSQLALLKQHTTQQSTDLARVSSGWLNMTQYSCVSIAAVYRLRVGGVTLAKNGKNSSDVGYVLSMFSTFEICSPLFHCTLLCTSPLNSDLGHRAEKKL